MDSLEEGNVVFRGEEFTGLNSESKPFELNLNNQAARHTEKYQFEGLLDSSIDLDAQKPSSHLSNNDYHVPYFNASNNSSDQIGSHQATFGQPIQYFQSSDVSPGSFQGSFRAPDNLNPYVPHQQSA